MRFPKLVFAVCLVSFTAAVPAHPYSVLSHEEVVDMAWKTELVPLLKARFPGIGDDAIRQAHAYAYGGSVIQDIGYYPFGSKYFSDLLHYVRPNDFVTALLRDSTTPDEYAFALGALAHFCGDTIGHPFVNEVTALENPPLRKRFGSAVTYEEDPTAHVRTEFGFDVVEVAHGVYSQQNYRDFVGFRVSKPLLERAFQETYGVRMSDIIPSVDLSIATYRKSVSFLIPEMTKIAYVNYKRDIEQAQPGISKQKFQYRLDKTEYARDYGTDTLHVGVGGHIIAFFLHILPKIGPLKALKVTIPNAKEQAAYLTSINNTVDQFRKYLAQVSAAPAPLPPPEPEDAKAAQKAADKLQHDARKATKRAEAAEDAEDKAKKQKAAMNTAKAAEKAAASADRVQAKVDAVQAGAALPLPPAAVAPGTLIQPPHTPKLPELDLDTGRPSASGEYFLADETYARLLADIVKPKAVDRKGDDPLNRLLAADIEHYFGHHAAAPAKAGTPVTISAKDQRKQAVLAAEVKTNLQKLKALETQADAPVTATF